MCSKVQGILQGNDLLKIDEPTKKFTCMYKAFLPGPDNLPVYVNFDSATDDSCEPKRSFGWGWGWGGDGCTL